MTLHSDFYHSDTIAFSVYYGDTGRVGNSSVALVATAMRDYLYIYIIAYISLAGGHVG
jgi:hypothetical protein